MSFVIAKYPPMPAGPGFPFADPSMFHFHAFRGCSCHARKFNLWSLSLVFILPCKMDHTSNFARSGTRPFQTTLLVVLSLPMLHQALTKDLTENSPFKLKCRQLLSLVSLDRCTSWRFSIMDSSCSFSHWNRLLLQMRFHCQCRPSQKPISSTYSSFCMETEYSLRNLSLRGPDPIQVSCQIWYFSLPPLFCTTLQRLLCLFSRANSPLWRYHSKCYP